MVVKRSLPFYTNSEFTGNKKAYFYIGSMAHLVQDQLVPAHAANIYHGIYKNYILNGEFDPDDLEAYVGEHGLLPYMGEEQSLGKDPLSYYYSPLNTDDSPIILTQGMIKTWNYPAAGPVKEWHDRRYWLANSNYPYVGQSFFGDLSKKSQLIGGWGIYGGPFGVDMYSRVSLSDVYVTDDPYEDIARTQLAEAASYAVGIQCDTQNLVEDIRRFLNTLKQGINGYCGFGFGLL